MKLAMKEYRLKKRLTFEELARFTGYSKSFLCLIENHKESPRLETVKKIAFALEICPKKLIYSCDHMESCENCHYK